MSHGAMLRTAVPTFASSRAWRRVVRGATGGAGVNALACRAAARSKQALASRIPRLVRTACRYGRAVAVCTPLTTCAAVREEIGSWLWLDASALKDTSGVSPHTSPSPFERFSVYATSPAHELV